ncbi:MAG: class I SAM-dependent methyltransferase [Chromatiales bacterium]
MSSSAKSRPRRTLAQKADRHWLYQRAVQCAKAEVDFVDETFRELRGRDPAVLREDFCGTALVACEWVRRRAGNLAIGVDLDPAVLAWARQHNLAKLNPSALARVTLLNEDVMKVRMGPVDALLAMNFSYWTFKNREELRAYFERARHGLARDGLLFLDAYGGYDAFRVLRERTSHRGFTYVWRQASYNPVSGETTCHIDFTFPDGSRLPRAFTYHWRLWTLPELREVLGEAGFCKTTVYWQDWDEGKDEPAGEFHPTEIGEPDAGWIAYLVAEN